MLKPIKNKSLMLNRIFLNIINIKSILLTEYMPTEYFLQYVIIFLVATGCNVLFLVSLKITICALMRSIKLKIQKNSLRLSVDLSQKANLFDWNVTSHVSKSCTFRLDLRYFFTPTQHLKREHRFEVKHMRII